MLKKKEVTNERPFQEFKDGSIKWMTDDNSIYFKANFLKDFYLFYLTKVELPFIEKNEIFKGLTPSFPEEKSDLIIEELIKINTKDLFEYFLVYCDLPSSVESFLISKYLYLKAEKAKIQDKVNQKRRVINGTRPI